MQQWKIDEPTHISHEFSFGRYLKMLRDRHGIKQGQVLAKLPATWTQPMYSDIERDRTSPSFDDLEGIYQALHEAGVQFTLQDRKHFLALAQEKLEAKRTHRVQKSTEAWSELGRKLMRIDHLPENDDLLTQTSMKRLAPPTNPVRREINHLLGRESWLDSLIAMIKGPPSLKVLVVQGPPGSGKTSELHRLANHFLQCIPRYYVVLSELPSIDLEYLEPDIALELLLGDILEVVGSPYASMPTTNLQARVRYVLECLARADRPVVVFLDNAEQALDKQGDLTPIWEQFLTRFAQARHPVSLILATQEWPSSFLAETQLIVTREVPPFSQAEGSALLHRLGLRDIPEEQLGLVVSAVGGVPLCLEWVARLAQEPLLHNNWADFEEDTNSEALLKRILEETTLFEGPVARRVQPLLERVIVRLSQGAHIALEELALSPMPLGAPALKVLYDDPAPLRELRTASLLVLYPGKQVQLLPMVAAQVRQSLSSTQVYAAEERLIQALTHWLALSRVSVREQGIMVTELTMLLLKHRRLLDAAEILVELGWLSSGYGQGYRLAVRAFAVMAGFDWQSDRKTKCGGILLEYCLGRFCGKKTSLQERAETYQHLLDLATTQQLSLKSVTIAHLIQHIANSFIIRKEFTRAYELLNRYLTGSGFQQETDQIDMLAPLLKTKAYALNAQGEREEEQGNKDEANRLKEEALQVDLQCICMLRRRESSVGGTKQSTVRYHLARILNEAGYILVNLKRGEEAMKALKESIQIKSEGYAQVGSLSMSIGEMGQALELVGKFQDALRSNAEALEETERLAASGHATARGDISVHLINRARLLLRVGNFEEAERLVNEATPSIRDTRHVYREKAQVVLDEIKGCRRAAQDLGHEYLDWRWYARYKQAIQFDVFGWLTHAGPFSHEEQDEWDFLRDRHTEQDQERKEQLIKASRDRELEHALGEGREPRLLYPAIQIEDVQAHRRVLQNLADEIRDAETNVLVGRLYLEAIEEQIDYLDMVAATFQGDAQAFWDHNRHVHAEPTSEEMETALSHLLGMLSRGSQQETTRATSQRLLETLQGICEVDPFLWSARMWKLSWEKSVKTLKTVLMSYVKRYNETLTLIFYV